MQLVLALYVNAETQPMAVPDVITWLLVSWEG